MSRVVAIVDISAGVLLPVLGVAMWYTGGILAKAGILCSLCGRFDGCGFYGTFSKMALFLPLAGVCALLAGAGLKRSPRAAVAAHLAAVAAVVHSLGWSWELAGSIACGHLVVLGAVAAWCVLRRAR